MRLKLYRAPRMAEAMAAVRAELGAEAFILSSRRVGGGFEITAAVPPGQVDPEPFDRAAQEQALRFHGVPPSVIGLLLEEKLSHALATHLRFAEIDFARSTRPVLFAGPAGAGKTLTVARIATRLVLGGSKPVVITADERKAGAIEQISALVRLLGLTLNVASAPAALLDCLARAAPQCPILIDMPGTHLFDPAERQWLQEFAHACDGRIALVLPAEMAADEACDIAFEFAAIGADLLMVTRLDVARRLGSIVAASRSGLSLAEAGVGAGAADGLVPLTPDLLATRLLHVPSNRNAHGDV